MCIYQVELSHLSPAAMAAYIRELEAELYELSQREARELSRSKHLRIFGNNRRRSSKWGMGERRVGDYDCRIRSYIK